MKTSEEALKKIANENDSLVKEYEFQDLMPEERALLDKFKETNQKYRSAREEVIKCCEKR